MKSVSVAQHLPLPNPSSKLLHSALTRWRWLRFGATTCLILVALFWVTVIALAAFLKWYIVPNIDSFRPRLEAYASAQLQRPVKIERLVAQQSSHSLDWLPHFELQGVQIQRSTPSKEPAALMLAKVGISVTPISLLQLKINQLSIDGLTLEVQRNSNGIWSIAGFDLIPSRQPSSAMNWLFSQREILITQGTLDFTDDYLKQPRVRLSNAQMVLRNSLRGHHARLDASLPTTWGKSLQWQAQFRQPVLNPNAGDWQSWSGTAYAKVTAPTPQGFAAYLPKQVQTYVDHLSGTDSMDAWLQIKQGGLHSLDVAAVGIPKLATHAKLHIEGFANHGADNAPAQLIVSGDANLNHADGVGAIKARWQQTSHALGELDLDATIQHFDLTALHRYLNLVPALTGSQTVHYVQGAFERGAATDIQIKLKGALKDFPFADKKAGEFKVVGRLKDTQFNVAPLAQTTTPEATVWPKLHNAKANFELNSLGLTLSNFESQWAGLAAKGDVVIANLKQPTVVIRAEAKAPISQWIKVANTTPIKAATVSVLAGASGTGSMTARMQLTIPASDPAQTKIEGTLTLPNDKSDAVTLSLQPSTPTLSDLNGSISFTESSMTIDTLTGRVLGGDFKVSSNALGSPAGGELIATGTVSAEALAHWQASAPSGAALAPALTPLLTNVQGLVPYNLRLYPSDNKGYRLLIESNLVGVLSKLPEPLTKAASTAWPTRLEYIASHIKPVLRTSIQVGDVMAALIEQDIASTPLRASIAVGRDAIAAGAAANLTLPERGINALLLLPSFDVDAWLKVTSMLSTTSARPVSPSASTSALPSTSLPVQMSGAIGQLTLANRRFDQVVLGVSHQNQLWRVNAKSSDLDGYFEYRAGQLHAKLAHLTIPDNASKAQLENMLQESPTSLPTLDIVVDEFELSGKRLGRLEIQAINQRSASHLTSRRALEWRMNKLWLINPDAVFKGTGVWSNQRVDLQFGLEVLDSGALLSRLGLPGTIQDGKGNIQGRVGWLGSPMALHYPSMAGQLKLDFSKGQFLKIDPGAGRLLSVLSLQALPKLLTLDFRDVFTEGFAFDSFGGDAQIRDGILRTENLQMKSTLALVSMSGQADLAKETQDLRVLVLPDVNAGGASLLATLINPVVGAVSYLAQLVLRRPLVKAATKEYIIQGTWQNPKVSQAAKP